MSASAPVSNYPARMGWFSRFRRLGGKTARVPPQNASERVQDLLGVRGPAADVSEFHIRAQLPDPGHWHVSAQWYVGGASATAAAERVRDIVLGGWEMCTFQVRLPDGRAYWWNSGAFTEQWLLTNRIPKPGEYNVVWELVLAHDPDDGQGAVRAAGDELQQQAATGELVLVVVDSRDRAQRCSPGPPIVNDVS